MGNEQKKAVNREYKDRLFKLVFQDKRDLLELYNAINNTSYDNPEDITVNTLQDVVYMGMKNDLSFLIAEELNLYEHQSTFNPNLPLRGFLYFADLYRKELGKSRDLYSSKLINLPTPQFVVFYNGEKEIPEEQVLCLSDAFHGNVEACLECKARVLDINAGKNQSLMEKSKRLKEYSIFIRCIRKNQETGMDIETAVDMAILDCIKNHVLKDILEAHQSEVKDMLLTEYNEELHIKKERELAEERGMERGMERGVSALIETCREINFSKEDTEKQIQKKMKLSKEDVDKYMEKYWK